MMVAALPKVLFSPFAGVLIDRWPLKKTMIISDLIRMFLVLLIPFLFYIVEFVSMSIILAITFLISTVSVFFYPAKSSSIPILVEKEKLLSANSISGTTQMSIGLLGLLGGAILVSVIGIKWAFLIDALSFLISAFFIFLIKYPLKSDTESIEKLNLKRYIFELKQGIKYISNDQLLWFMLLFFVSIMLLGGAVNILLFAYIQDILKQDASAIGYLYSANMVGMIIGMIAIPKITKKYPKEKLLVWSTLIFAFTIGSLAWIDSLTIALIIMVIEGFGNGILNVVSSTIFQEQIKEEMRGRVFSVIDASINSAALISMLPAAWLAQKFGVANIFLITGILIFIIFLISLKRINQLYKTLVSENHKMDKISTENGLS